MSTRRGLSCRQAAMRIGVGPQTLQRWIDLGEGPRAFIKVHPVKGGTRRTIRIMPEDLERFINANSKGRA